MKLLFAGDVMLGRLVNRELGRRPPEFPWGDTLPLFRGADARVCNLECVISDRGRPWSATPKIFHFRTDSRNVEVLRKAGINAVSVANNHALDYEFDAMFDMLGILDSSGIAHAGAGRDIEEASSPCFFDIRGRRAAMIAFTDNEPAWEARAHKPGVYHVPVSLDDPRAHGLFERVADARRKAGLVIVSAHWGPNWGYRPEPVHRPFARRLIDSGADIVFGHSCHVFQGVEYYGGGAIIYSAGDFIDDYAVDEVERNDESFIFVAEADGGGEGKVSSISLFPTVIDAFSVSRADSPRAELICGKMKSLSEELGARVEWDEGAGALKVAPQG